MIEKSLNRLIYNIKGIARMCVPSFCLPKNREKILRDLDSRKDLDYIKKRVDYYCPLSEKIALDSDAKMLEFLRWTHKQTVYFFDCYEYAQYFPQHFKAHFEFGDVYYALQKPSFTKSRPIFSHYETLCESANGGGQNDLNSADLRKYPPFANSTLLNMVKIRHFVFINDNRAFQSKQNKLFYRGGIYKSNRVEFFNKYFDNPLCDLGHTGSKSVHKSWQKPKISIAKHLPYKFLLSLEGNDVASNLKWVMSSNSLCVAPKMKFETWFMEGRLKGGEHFVEINEDYSDLEEKLEYFIAHPKDAMEIIHNAHKYIAQFRDKKREDIISLLVLEKYFYYTGQLDKMRI